jgi:hypothetical protein
MTFGLGLLFFVLLFAAGELLARLDMFQTRLTAPELGSTHRQFETQMHRLETLFKREGAVECIFLGNSMVWGGFDPLAFTQTYQSKTGQDIRCFNFGVDGMPASASGVLAEILIEDYHPQLLIYGTDARDYAVTRDARDAVVLLDSPWLQYRQGRFTVEGFLFEHSYLYRYREQLCRLLRFDYTQLRSGPDRSPTTGYGFDPNDRIGSFVQTIPDPQDPRGPIQYYFSVLSDYQMLPVNLDGLEKIVAQNDQDTQVLVVEMPVPETYMYFFANREEDYQRFINRARQMAADHDVPFVQTTPLNLIPDDGWVDYSHLNTRGAGIFSAWLGKQMGEAAVQHTSSK